LLKNNIHIHVHSFQVSFFLLNWFLKVWNYHFDLQNYKDNILMGTIYEHFQRVPNGLARILTQWSFIKTFNDNSLNFCLFTLESLNFRVPALFSLESLILFQYSPWVFIFILVGSWDPQNDHLAPPVRVPNFHGIFNFHNTYFKKTLFQLKN
jgi:hypothetical protein